MSNYWKKRYEELYGSESPPTGKSATGDNYWKQRYEEMEAEQQKKKDNDLAPKKSTETGKSDKKEDEDELRDASWWDATVNSAKRGYYNALYGEETFASMLGQKNSADVFRKILEGDEYQFEADGTAKKAVSGAAELLGQMARQFTNKDTLAAVGAGAGSFATTAALLGQAGPQIAAPEEIITVPAALIAGAGAGFTAGSAKASLEIEAGHAYNEMIENGISEKTAKNIALAVGGVNAGLELLQVDELFKAFKVLNKTGATDTVVKRISKELLARGIDVAKETAQEVAQEGVTIAGVQAASKKDKGEWAYTKEAVASRLGETAASSALSFGVLNVPAGVSHVGQIVSDNTKSQKLTENEQKVVEKEIENRIAEQEKDGKNLTNKEKAVIEDKVIRDMERGYISTDTIEEVLGGETYKTHRDTLDSEKAMQEEYDALYKMKTGDKSDEQIDRQAELKKKLEDIKQNFNRNQLGEEVMSLVQNDRLAESYNEVRRKGEDFVPDFDKFKDAKHADAAKKTLENAVRLGVNNSNKVHDFVDLVAKTSGDIGKVIDFKTGEQIKAEFIETQTAEIAKLEKIENLTPEQTKQLETMKEVLAKVQSGETTIHGSFTGDGIVLNIDSPNALNRVVGHEVMHGLEKAKYADRFKKALFSFAKTKGVDVDAELARRKATYAGIANANPEAELVTDMVGDYLFSDADFVKHLSVTDRNVFQKIYDEIKYLYKLATAGSKEARELERVKKLFEDVYRDTKNTIVENGVRYELGSTENVTPSQEQRQLNIQKVASMEAVYKVDAAKLVPSGKPIKDVYRDHFASWGENIHSEIFGDIAAKNSSIRSDIRHGSTPVKIASIEAIPSVIQQGEIVEWIDKGNGVLRIVVAAPVDIGEKSYYMGVMLQRDSQYQRLYIHDVVVKKEAFNPTEEHLNSTGSNDEGENLFLSTILDKIVTVKRNISEHQNSGHSISDSDSKGRELSPAVQNRFGKSKVVDENGSLKVVYHGTATGEFSIFDKTKGSVEGDYGSGFYFTDNEADASEHYEGGGPDFDNKVGRRADEIWGEEPDIEYEEAEKRAREELYKGSHKFEVYLNIENPAIVGKTMLFDSESYMEQYNEEDYDDYDDYLGDVEQLVADDIENVLWEVERNVDVDNTDGISAILWDAYSEGGIGLEDLKKRLNDLYLEDSNGNLVANEVARQIIESLGYDGIIDPTVSGKWNMDIEEGTTHYIVFKPNQIKAVTNENPTDNPDINRSLSNGGESFAPRTSFDVFGSDLKKVAPKETAPVQEIAPVREDVAENATTTAETKDDAPADVADSAVLKRLNSKLSRLNEELAKNQTLQAESIKSFDEKIAKAQAELDAKKNKDTKVANAIKRRIERLKRLKADVDAEYTKRISDIKARASKTEESIGKYHPGLDRTEKAIARIDKMLEYEKAELAKEVEQKREQLKDKDAYISQRASELYDEIRSIKKGVKASDLLGELLDSGHDWSSIRSALVNIKHTPNNLVNQNSAVEPFVREVLDEDYENRLLDLDEDYANQVKKLDEEAATKRKNATVAGQRKAKQQEYSEQMENLVGDTSTWKDKKLGISYKTETLRRNLRDVVLDANGEQDIAKADAIYDELQGKYNTHEAILNRESNQIKQPYADMKITKAEDVYIQMLGEFRHNPDTTLTAEAVEEFYEKNKKHIDKDKVDKAIDMARQTYDELLIRVNEVLREQGMKEIPYRKGYFPHFTEDKQSFLAKLFNWKTHNDDIPTDIAGLTENFNPNRSWQSFNKERKSDTTDYSFAKGMDTYVHGALDWIYHIEDIQKRRAFENHLRYIHSEKGVQERIDAIRNNTEYDADEMQDQIDLVYANAGNPLNNFVTDLRAGTNRLANKKSSMDRGVEEATNRKLYSVMTNISNRVSANMVGGSISSALTNFIPITQSWGQVSPVSSLRAMRETIKSAFRDDGTVDKSDFLTNRLRASENLFKSGWDKVSDVVGIMFDAIDSFTAQTVWRSKYLENISNGMSENEAIKNADQFAENVIAGRSRGNQPTIFESKNPFIKTLTAFQLEVNNQYRYLFKDMPQDVENKVKLVWGWTKVFLGAYAYNALYSSLVGRDAAFDPIGIIEDLLRDLGLFGDDDEEEEIAPVDVVMNLTENILQEVPFVGGLMGGGRVPISSALPYDGNVMDIVESVAKLTDKDERDWREFTSEWLKPVYYLAPPVGGGQIKKTIEGLSMFSDDLPIAGSYTKNGDLRFPVDDTIGNKVKAGLFGQWASENARTYFDNDLAPLDEKKIQEYTSLGLSYEDYWSYRDDMSAISKRAEEDGASDEDVVKSKYIASVNSELSKIQTEKDKVMEDTKLSDKQKEAKIKELDKRFSDIANERYNSYNDVSFDGDFANIGDHYYQWYTPKNGEAYWRKLDDDQVAKYQAIRNVGANAHYATNGTTHYRLEEGGNAKNFSDWTKISDKELARQREVTRELGITPEEYWSKTEKTVFPMYEGEYEYAHDNPGNYAIANAVGGYDTYMSYKDEISSIKKNNSDGSGVKDKDLVVDYINGLDMDYVQKAILFRSMYSSKQDRADYDDDIINYLISDTKMSYEDKVEILKKLGYEVSSDGTITWKED